MSYGGAGIPARPIRRYQALLIDKYPATAQTGPGYMADTTLAEVSGLDCALNSIPCPPFDLADSFRPSQNDQDWPNIEKGVGQMAGDGRSKSATTKATCPKPIRPALVQRIWNRSVSLTHKSQRND